MVLPPRVEQLTSFCYHLEEQHFSLTSELLFSYHLISQFYLLLLEPFDLFVAQLECATQTFETEFSLTSHCLLMNQELRVHSLLPSIVHTYRMEDSLSL